MSAHDRTFAAEARALRLRHHQPYAAVWRRAQFGCAIVFRIRRRDIWDMDDETKPKALTPEAQRALAEAAERRKQAEKLPSEQGGPPGPEPTRFGDWERKGIAVDF